MGNKYVRSRYGKGLVFPPGTLGYRIALGQYQGAPSPVDVGFHAQDNFTGPLKSRKGVERDPRFPSYVIVWDRGRVKTVQVRALNPQDQRKEAMHVLRREASLPGVDRNGDRNYPVLKADWRARRKAVHPLHKCPSPVGIEAYTGLELEMTLHDGVRDDVCRLLLQAGLGGYVGVTDDCSIKKEGALGSCELRVLATMEHLPRVVRKIFEVLKPLDPGVNSSCGFHVHLDCRSRDPEVVWENLHAFQDLLLRAQPRSRIMPDEGGGFCKRSDKIPLDKAINSDRYRALNATALPAHGTIEVRAHTGTVNPAKIIAWATLLNEIADMKEIINARDIADLGSPGDVTGTSGQTGPGPDVGNYDSGQIANRLSGESLCVPGMCKHVDTGKHVNIGRQSLDYLARRIRKFASSWAGASDTGRGIGDDEYSDGSDNE